MLRPSSAVLLLVCSLILNGASGQSSEGPPLFVVPLAAVAGSDTTSSLETSPLQAGLLSATPFTPAPTFGEFGPTFSQPPLSSTSLSIVANASVSSDSVIPISTISVTLALVSVSSSTGANGSTTSPTGSMSSLYIFPNGTSLATSVILNSTAAATSWSVVTETIIGTTSAFVSASDAVTMEPTGPDTSPADPSVVFVTALAGTPGEISPPLPITETPFLWPMITLGQTPVGQGQISTETVTVQPSPNEITVTELAPPTSQGISATTVSLPNSGPITTSPYTSSNANLPWVTDTPGSCTATIFVTQTVTVFETVTETCPQLASTVTFSTASQGPNTSAQPTESAETCNVDSSTGCDPGISKLFGPIVVDVLIEAPPSTFSTVTVYTTSGFVTQTEGTTTGVGGSVGLPPSCSLTASGNIVCNGCPTSLFGVTCQYICTVEGSPDLAGFCEQTDMTGTVAADEGVMQCLPCAGVSSTFTFAPTEPIVKGVSGIPAATITFAQTPSGGLASSGQTVGVTQPDFLSPASGPAVYGASATSSLAIVPTSSVSSFTLVALSSPAIPVVEVSPPAPTPISPTLLAPTSIVVTSLPHLSEGLNPVTMLSTSAVAASSVPREPQVSPTVSAGVGPGSGSCTSVAAGTKPSPAYTDKQNGMLYRIQCGTTLDLVLQCPYLCSEGGGGLFRQCENSDQSGPAPTAGGVGIVCQKCLAPCGSSTKRENEIELSEGRKDAAVADLANIADTSLAPADTHKQAMILHATAAAVVQISGDFKQLGPQETSSVLESAHNKLEASETSPRPTTSSAQSQALRGIRTMISIGARMIGINYA